MPVHQQQQPGLVAKAAAAAAAPAPATAAAPAARVEQFGIGYLVTASG